MVDTGGAQPSNFLSARFETTNGNYGKLWVRVDSGGFAGEAGAWFDEGRVIEFASLISAYPLPADDPPTIASGFGKSETDLDQEQVRLTVKPVGGKGQVGVLVHLAAELWPDARPESVSELRLEFLTSYEQLRTFSDDLRRAVQGDLDVATLNGEVLR
jgi:hypothetical protein